MTAHRALQLIPCILKIKVFKHGDAKPNNLYAHNKEGIDELLAFAAAVELLAKCRLQL